MFLLKDLLFQLMKYIAFMDFFFLHQNDGVKPREVMVLHTKAVPVFVYGHPHTVMDRALLL